MIDNSSHDLFIVSIFQINNIFFLPQNSAMLRKRIVIRRRSSAFVEIDRILKQTQTAYNINLEALQTYIEIFRNKKMNLKTDDIKLIYRLFSENRTNQILYDQTYQFLASKKFDAILLQRYYARVIELSFRKISYFYLNSNSLAFLSQDILQLMEILDNFCKDISSKSKNLHYNHELLKVIFEENGKIEKKIYQKLIDDGYLSSIDEFYRINGVEIVKDSEEYHRSLLQQQPTNNNKQNYSYVEEKIRQCEARLQIFHNERISGRRSKNSFIQNKVDEKIKRKVDSKIIIMHETLQNIISNSEKTNDSETNHFIRKGEREGKGKDESKNQLLTSAENNKNSKKGYKKMVTLPLNSRNVRKESRRQSLNMNNYFSDEFKSAILSSPSHQILGNGGNVGYFNQFLLKKEANLSQNIKKEKDEQSYETPIAERQSQILFSKNNVRRKNRSPTNLLGLTLRKNNQSNIIFEEIKQNPFREILIYSLGYKNQKEEKKSNIIIKTDKSERKSESIISFNHKSKKTENFVQSDGPLMNNQNLKSMAHEKKKQVSNKIKLYHNPISMSQQKNQLLRINIGISDSAIANQLIKQVKNRQDKKFIDLKSKKKKQLSHSLSKLQKYLNQQPNEKESHRFSNSYQVFDRKQRKIIEQK